MEKQPKGNKKKALTLLTKLLKAAQRAQKEGKNVALDKLVSEADKLSHKIETKQKQVFKHVDVEIVDEPNKNFDENVDEIIKKNKKEIEICEQTVPQLKAEHNNLAIIAAKQDFGL